jgi:hypothetical protein
MTEGELKNKQDFISTYVRDVNAFNLLASTTHNHHLKREIGRAQESLKDIIRLIAEEVWEPKEKK